VSSDAERDDLREGPPMRVIPGFDIYFCFCSSLFPGYAAATVALASCCECRVGRFCSSFTVGV
jgi:hypothetical protein